MRYNAHRLLHQAANQPCLRCELVITDAQKHKLQTAQKLVRNALRAGLRVAGAYLTQDEVPLVKAHGVPDPAALSFTPKFRTQGSWAYGTLNQPAKACQQLDLDDGMYVPMSIVGLNPAVASNTLFAIVERILGALCDAQGWTLDTSKSICVRVVIDAEAHLDLNIYAIPDVKMALLEKAFHAAANRAMAGSAFSSPPPEIRLDPSEIYVAHRTTGWEQSDPLELEDWFVNAAARHASWTDLKRLTRYLKAWRDYHWDSCRLSSLVLMVCAVEALDEANTPPQPGRDDDGLLVVARALSAKIAGVVWNPVVDDKALNDNWTTTEQNQFELKARALASELDGALNNETSIFNVVERFRRLFGHRVPDNAALVSPIASASQVRSTVAAQSPSPRVGSQTSG
ncbi:CBASS cGAMP synthase [Brevundimonas vesicularis]|uniref:CBASS cGAMP synthase n=1 Tax=Brevundimonas vesicularis TaxID=41276 RepID=UPI000830A8A1|nr:hypothetical protein [Brevundimonas vesicularis]